MKHHEKVYEGQHEAIIPIELWNAVQEKIHSQLNAHRSKVNVPSDSLLVGILFDENSERLIPSHTQRQSKRFRYYISDNLNNGLKEHAPHGMRIPAKALEYHVIHQLCDWLGSESNTVRNQPIP